MKEFFNLIQEKTHERELLEEHRKALDLVSKKNTILEKKMFIYEEIVRNLLSRIDELKQASPDFMTKDRALMLIREDIKTSLKELDMYANLQI